MRRNTRMGGCVGGAGRWHTRCMADIDQLARQTTALVSDLARKGMALATGVAILVLVVGGLSYLTGLAGLEGSARSAWTVVGLAMLVAAVGAPLLARRRLARVRRHVSALVGEVRTLITRDPEAQQVVIETVAHDEQPDPVRELRPVVYDSRQFDRLRVVSVRANDLRELPGALYAVTTFPWLLLMALGGVVVFGILGFFFMLAWIF
jgi:hypothetical protein